MTKLYDGITTDLLPPVFAENIEVQCFAYAVQQEKQRILDETEKTRTITVIDELPEKILDVLAVELRTPYYQEGMDLDTKRSIIKNTLLWHTKAGTPAAVEELVQVIFGVGEVVEWFDYTEGPYTPGTFDILTNARMTEDVADYFLQIIQRVKNTRSHIRRILIQRGIDLPEYAGAAMSTNPQDIIYNHTTQEIAPVQPQYGGAAALSNPKIALDNNIDSRETDIEGQEHIAVALAASSHTTIENCATATQTDAAGTMLAAAAVKSSTNIIIYNGGIEMEAEVSETQQTAAAMVARSNIII